MLIHTAVYAGVPAANSAVATRPEDARRAVTNRGDHFVQSLERGLAVIRAFGADDPELTLSDVARRTGLTRAAARRFLLTLTDLGYVRTDGKQFALTPRVLELGYAYLSSLTLPEIAEPHLERLAADGPRILESVSVLDGDDDRLRRPRPDLADHARLDQRRHPLPRLRDLDGPRPARGALRRRTDARTSPAPRSARSPPARSPPRRPAGRAGTHPRAGLGARRPGARGGPALDRRARPRRRRPDRRRRQRLRARHPRLPRHRPQASSCRRCWTPRRAIEADLRDVSPRRLRAS